MKVQAIELIGETVFGGTDGFLVLHRARLRNRREDGSLSEPYVCDYVNRPRAHDAVVVALYRRAGARIEVLVRAGLRPPLSLGRNHETRIFFAEAVAGLIEHEDVGEEGVRRRAALEAHEEAGYRIDPADVEFLGAATYPTPGALPEAFRLTAAEVTGAPEDAPGDGSPMEEGASCRWMSIDDAISACVSGEIQDLKTEVAFRRLRDQLAAR